MKRVGYSKKNDKIILIQRRLSFASCRRQRTYSVLDRHIRQKKRKDRQTNLYSFGKQSFYCRKSPKTLKKLKKMKTRTKTMRKSVTFDPPRRLRIYSKAPDVSIFFFLFCCNQVSLTIISCPIGYLHSWLNFSFGWQTYHAWVLSTDGWRGRVSVNVYDSPVILTIDDFMSLYTYT